MTDSAPTPEPVPEWLDDLSFKPGPPWVTMGVRALDLAHWLVFDERSGAEHALKLRLDAQHPDEVFRAEPGTEAIGQEVLAMVQGWLSRHQPMPNFHRSPEINSAHPLQSAAWLVPEDLCVMAERDGRYELVAASVSFPSHWRLGEKMGRGLATIHEPVHHYAEELEHKVATFMARLTEDRPVVRRNLSVHDHDELFRPEPPETYEHYDGGVEGLWLRSERQTLVRLPQSGAVLFTIKTQQCRAGVLATRPDLCAAMATKYRALMHESSSRDQQVHVPEWWPDWLAAHARH